MKKNKIFVLLLVFCIFFLVSCNDGKPTPTIEEKYTITWINYNGDILKTDTDVPYGTIPTYTGSTPTKEEDQQYTYSFSGWDPEIQKVTKDITYTAIFTETVKNYTVTWKNHDGAILETNHDVPYGTVPTYSGPTPIKEQDEQYVYDFSGWSPVVEMIKGNISYTAMFSKTIRNYTVTWINHDGAVLKIDNDIPYGTMPTYNGPTPTKQGDEDVTYLFKGWSPVVEIVKADVVYTATFETRYQGDLVPGIIPVFSPDNKTVQYGFYPQTYVNDESLISILNTLSPSETNGWYLYNGVYYTKINATIYNNEKYTFDDGTPIVNGVEYWFECEPITWQILSNDDGTYYLLSSLLLDLHAYYKDYADRTIDGKTISANNYQYSDIRTWLNNDFYNLAFTLNNTYIIDTVVDNSSSTTDSLNNQFAGEKTTDKVYLPSYKDYLNPDYGFDSNSNSTSVSRESKTTDYVRARGAWYNNTNNALKYNSSYWTRTPSSEFYYSAWNVNSGGYLSSYAVDGNNHCVRPSISLKISHNN